MTDNPQVSPAILSDLKSKFKIIDCLNFLFHDHDPKFFYEWCSKWKDYTFAPNERILISHFDTDYYSENRSGNIGNSNWNFFSCANHFSLPTCFFIYFTSNIGRRQEMIDVCQLYRLAIPATVESPFALNMIPNVAIKDIDYSADSINRHFVSVNGQCRQHRVLLLCHLVERGLFEQGYISHNFTENPQSILGNASTIDMPSASVTFRNTTPFTRINDSFAFSSLDRELYIKHCEKFLLQDQTLDRYGIIDQGYSSGIGIDQASFYPEYFKHALVFLVTESILDYPHIAFSEKTFKSILNKRPFVILGAQKTLSNLQELGFKTFGEFWDESYDSIADASQRLNAVVDVIDYICRQDLNDLAQKVQDVVEYNFNHYHQSYADGSFYKWYDAE